MSNKVTNIYIDTTGFSDEAKYRVSKALDIIVDYNEIEGVYPSNVKQTGNHSVAYFSRDGLWYYASPYSPLLEGKKSVGLWELESIAFRCKQEKKKEPLPTRNIYIDARKLDHEQRRNAHEAISHVSSGLMTGWLPAEYASGPDDDAALMLFDIFAIDDDRDRRFYSGRDIDEIHHHLDAAKELTYDQLMSLTR